MEMQKVLKKSESKAVEFKDGLAGVDRVETIPIKDIDQDDRKFQYRLNERADILRTDISSQGQLVPVVLWGENPPYKIVDGFRRISVVNSIGWPEVKAIVHRKISEDDAYRLSFIENVKRKSFTPLDAAHAVWKATERGKSNKQLMDEFNITERQIQRYREILKFSKPIQKALSGEAINMAQAKILNDYKVKDIDEWVERIKEGLSAANLRKELKKQAGRKKRTKTFIQKSDDGFRLYEVKYDANTSPERRAEIKKALEAALQMIADDENA